MPKYKPACWKLYQDGVSNSFLSLWLRCREQARLKYLEGWTPKTSTVALEFGNAFHYVLEHWKKPRRVTPITVKEQIVKLCKQYVKHFDATVQGQNMDPKLKNMAFGLAQIMLPNYMEQYKDDAFKWHSREHVFKVDFPLSNGKTVPITGKWDGVFKRGRRLWLREIKTRGQLRTADIVDTLQWDTQTMLYCWAVYKSFGRKPEGFLYDVVARPGLYQRKDEFLASYLVRCDEDIKSSMSGDDDKRRVYFFRHWMTLLKSDWERLEHWLDNALCDLVNWYDSLIQYGPDDSPNHYMNPGELVGKYGRTELFDLITKGKDPTLYRRDTPHVELVI